jgi:hypothetical protein
MGGMANYLHIMSTRTADESEEPIIRIYLIVEREMLCHEGFTGPRQPAPQILVTQKAEEGISQASFIVARKKESIDIVSNDLIDAHNIRPYHGDSRCHRFKHGKGQPFVDRGQAEDVKHGEEVRHVMTAAQEENLVGGLAFGRKSL